MQRDFALSAIILFAINVGKKQKFIIPVQNNAGMKILWEDVKIA